jgi:hypothetical protein
VNSQTWSSANVDYGCKLMDSLLDGARAGQQDYLAGEPMSDFLSRSARAAATPALIGACIGLLGSQAWNRRSPRSQNLAFGLVGGAIGFGLGMAWVGRFWAATVVSGAAKSVGRIRDEHWLETHPIDYA